MSNRINSRRKGAGAEREFANLLKSYGFNARRGQQYRGSSDSPDVISEDLPIAWEVKRRQHFNLHDTIDKLCEEHPKGKWRCVAHRQNGREWLITTLAGDFFDLIQEWKDRDLSDVTLRTFRIGGID